MGVCDCFCGILHGFFKYIIFLFNLLFVLAGITILTLGVLLEVRILDISQYLDVNIHTSSIILMVGGGVIILVAFFGCCGAISNNRCLLNLYATFLLVALCLQVAGFVLVIAWNPDLSVDLQKEMKSLMTSYTAENDGGEIARKFWDTLQKSEECCGINSNQDWFTYTTLSSLPESCKCLEFDKPCNSEGFYLRGCYDFMEEVLFSFQYYMAWVAIGVAAFELLVGTLTLIYANSGRQRRHSV